MLEVSHGRLSRNPTEIAVIGVSPCGAILEHLNFSNSGSESGLI